MKLLLKKKTLIPVVSGLIAIVWLVYGKYLYGYWDEIKGPLPGLVPSIMAAVMLVVSILAAIESLKEKDAPDRLENWAILLAAFAAFGLVFIVGMMISLLVFVCVWMRWYEKMGWKHTVIALIISFGIAYGIFVVWLGVPFPNGALVDAILY